MFRVAWKFCSTRIIIATIIHLISIICGLGVCVFAKLCLESIVEMDEQKSNVWGNITFDGSNVADNGNAFRNASLYSIGIVLCLFLMHFFESSSSWINLR